MMRATMLLLAWCAVVHAPQVAAQSAQSSVGSATATSSASAAPLSPEQRRALRAQRVLEQLVAEASRRNVVPPDLAAYTAKVETDLSIVVRREDGLEATGLAEQVASTLHWSHAGEAEQHVVGYRAQQTGPALSLLSAFPTGWVIPTLYGNRLRAITRSARPGPPVVGRMRERVMNNTSQPDTVAAIHPLASDRTQYYTFAGGDTVVTIAAGERRIAIVRVRVTPRPDVAQRVLGATVVFEGEMDLDAGTATLVRLRGSFVRVGGARRGVPAPLQGMVRDVVAFVELENGEQEGRWWLPVRQRIEVQGTSPLLGESRAVVRLVSRYREVQTTRGSVAMLRLLRDSVVSLWRVRLTSAPADSLTAFDRWQSALGAVSAEAHSDDFLDVAPNTWRPTGAPRWSWGAERSSDLLHFNRVDGFYTGVGARWALRDAAPGVVVRATAGYAWQARAVRGRVLVARTRGPWMWTARAGRSLDITNDFLVPFDSGSSGAALFGSRDAYDYVDRRSATLAVTRTVGARAWLVRGELGVADDRDALAVYARSPLGGALYRQNRGVDAGGYVRSLLAVEWHPDVQAEFVKPGVGGRLWTERGDGTLHWQRVEARLVARAVRGPVTLVTRVDAGRVFGDRPPPQQLFELGDWSSLPGAREKMYAGTDAVLARVGVQLALPIWRSPVRFGRFTVPSIAPALAAGVQSGWADAPTAAGMASIARLSRIDERVLASWAPVAQPTGGVRSTTSVGVRVFGGSVFVGAARVVEPGARWRAQITVGQPW